MIVEQTSFTFVDEHNFAIENVDFVLFHEAANTASHLANHTVFKLLRFLEVHFNAFSCNTKSIRMFRRFISMSCRDQSLGRNTTTVQTNTAKLGFISDNYFLTQLGSANGCHITARTCSND
ncbi:hypothetical protein D3C80_1420350 [compost metagenome]